MKKLKYMTNKELIKYTAERPTGVERELSLRLTRALAKIKTLKTPDPNEICISWHVLDVIHASEMGVLKEPTIEQAREVLRRTKDQHDANVGINWGTIGNHLLDVLKEGVVEDLLIKVNKANNPKEV